MNKEIKRAVLLIVIGICIPLAALPFVSGYERGKGFMHNFYSVGIPLTKAAPASTTSEAPAGPDKPVGTTASPKKIPFDIKLPYRVFFAFTVVFAFIGIIRIDRAMRQKKSPPETHQQEQE